MVATFECPECGEEVILEGLAPGRLTKCLGCGTLVEVPYLPRVDEGGTRRFRSARRSKRFWQRVIAASVAAAVVVAVGISALKLVHARIGSVARAQLNEVLASVDSAEKAGQLGRALAEIEAAMRLAHDPNACDAERRDALRVRRADLSLREATARLTALALLEPERAVGEALILRQRVKSDRALTGIGSAVELGLESSRRRWFDRDMRAAQDFVEAGQPNDAVSKARRAWATASDLTDDARRAQVEAFVSGIAGRSGVIIEPVRGVFFLGSVEIYTKQLGPGLLDALRFHHYVPPPPVPEWAALWQSLAPNRVVITINEVADGLYLQSKNQSSRLECRVKMTRKRTLIWELALNARTGQGPILANMRAYQAGHLGTSAKRNPEDERILFNDAFKALQEQFGNRIRTLPDAGL